MERTVAPELLDFLPPADARAARSRQDLVRVNAWMGHCGVVVQTLRAVCAGPAPRRVVELGAGDGRFLLSVARRLPAAWRGTTAVLLDRLQVVSVETCRDFEAIGWRVEVVQADALEWLAQPAPLRCDVMLANLFLHHFKEAPLTALLGGVARQARAFIAAEPRRSLRSLFFSRLLWLIGCNDVTRHDAPVSVQAGFAGSELSRLWPAGQSWTLNERPIGWFSHLLVAQRTE
jgi:hypothetical protein